MYLFDINLSPVFMTFVVYWSNWENFGAWFEGSLCSRTQAMCKAAIQTASILSNFFTVNIHSIEDSYAIVRLESTPQKKNSRKTGGWLRQGRCPLFDLISSSISSCRQLLHMCWFGAAFLSACTVLALAAKQYAYALFVCTLSCPVWSLKWARQASNLQKYVLRSKLESALQIFLVSMYIGYIG